MDSRINFDALLDLAKNNISKFVEIQPTLGSFGLSDTQLHKIYLTAVNTDPDAIDIVPASRRDEEILIAFITHKENKNDINRIFENYINQENANYNILVAFVSKDIKLLIDIRNKEIWERVSQQFNLREQQTFATLCLDVLKNNWRAMRLYPGTLIENNTVMQAIQKCKDDVSKDWRDIIYVPEYLLEDKFFQPSILKAQQAIMSGELEPTSFTSQRILTENCCLAAIARDVYNFRNIPSILRTKKVCHEAIKDAVYLLWDIKEPEDRLGLTPNEYTNLCVDALEKHGSQALGNIQNKMRTYDLCLSALNKDVEALRYLMNSNEREGLNPGEYNKLCLEAIGIYGAKAFQYISREMCTYDLYVAALNKNIDVLQFLKNNYDDSRLTSVEYDKLLKLATEKYGIEAVSNYIPAEMRSKSLWIAAIIANGMELYNLRESTRETRLTQDDYRDIRLAAIMEHGYSALRRIDPEMWEYELLLAAINKDIDTLNEITKNLKRTPLKPDECDKIFSIAKDKYGIRKIFPYLPPQMRSYDLCLEAINNDLTELRQLEKPEDREGLKPGEYNKLCLAAIEQHGYSTLYYIPPKMRIYELCLAAVNKNVYALRYLEKTEEREGLKPGEYNKLCLEAIERYDYSALRSIPPDMRTYELCLAAVNKNIYALSIIEKKDERSALTADQYADLLSVAKTKYGIEQTFRYLSPEMRTYDLCLEAVTKDVYVLSELEKPEYRIGLKPGEYTTLCLSAFKIHGTRIFRYISPEMWSYDLCLAVITQNLHWLVELKENREQIKLTSDEYTNLYLEAYKVHGTSALPYYPPEMRTFNIYSAAIKKDVSALQYLRNPRDREVFDPDDYHKLCLEAIDLHGSSALGYIDSDMLTEDLLMAALNKDVGALHYIYYNQKNLKSDYLTLCKEAVVKYGIKETFRYLPFEMKTYDVCLAAANNDVDVLCYLKTPKDRQKLTSKEYSDLCLVVIKKRYLELINPTLKKGYVGVIDNSLTDDILRGFIDHYESINKHNNYKLDDIGTFFSWNDSLISDLYSLLGKHVFLLMEKMLVTSADNLNRYLLELKDLHGQMLASCSKNISRLLDNIDFKNASKKGSQLKLYLFLSKEEKEEINVLLDDNKVNIETIPNLMRELLIKRFYDYLKLPYNNKEKNVMDTLSNEQLADLNSLLADLQKNPDRDKSKMFFSILKIYLGNIPFQNLHQPDEMSKTGDEYIVQMAAHNKKIREELAGGGIDVDKAFSYKKQIPLTFDEHQKQKILAILSSIYKKIKDSTVDKKPDAINKNIKNLIAQIEKGKDSPDNKLLKLLSEANIALLKKIADGVLPDIKDEYLELTKLEIKTEVLKNYNPRKFHIEMWDKSKIETLFLGDYLSCCLATTGSMRSEYAPRVFDDAFLMPVIIDEATKRPICGAWLFLGEATMPPSNEKTFDTVANFFEINAGIAENKELMNFLVVNLLNYIGQFSESIKAAEFIMRPLTYGLIPDFHKLGTFTATNKRTVEKVGGYLGNNKYYLNAVGTENFYLFNKASFGEEMQKLFAPDPKTPEYASSITLGFAAKPTTKVSDKEGYPTIQPSVPIHKG